MWRINTITYSVSYFLSRGKWQCAHFCHVPRFKRRWDPALKETSLKPSVYLRQRPCSRANTKYRFVCVRKCPAGLKTTLYPEGSPTKATLQYWVVFSDAYCTNIYRSFVTHYLEHRPIVELRLSHETHLQSEEQRSSNIKNSR